MVNLPELEVAGWINPKPPPVPSESLSTIFLGKASTTICRLVLSSLSQFFQSRRHFSSQAKGPPPIASAAPRRCAVRCVSPLPPRLPTGLAPQWQRASRCNPRPPAVLHLTEAVSAPVKHRQSPGPVGNVGGSHVYPMGQSWRVHRDMTLDSRHLLACVIALVPGGVLHALGVHDAEAGLLFPTIALPGRANRFFLGLAPEWNPDPGQAARSIAGNTGSRCANRGSPRAAFATGSRFSGGTVRRRKRRTSPRCGAWSGVGPVGRIRANCSRLMSLG